MPHVDEGTLHAYLDGALDALVDAGALPPGITREAVEAHLDACADCRALLTAERAIRTRAAAVLADAGGAPVDVPPFAALRTASAPPAEQRTSQASGGSSGARRTWPLAWAASVLLAAGAGWWGSEVYRAGFRTDSGASEAAAPAMQMERNDAAPPDAAADAAALPAAEPVASRDAMTSASVPLEQRVPGTPAPTDAELRSRGERETAKATTGRAAQDVAQTAALRQEQLQRAPLQNAAAQNQLAAQQQSAARVDSGRTAQQQSAAGPDSIPVARQQSANAADSARAALAGFQRRQVEAMAATPPSAALMDNVARRLVQTPGFRSAESQDEATRRFRVAAGALAASRIAWNDTVQTGLPLVMIRGGNEPEIRTGQYDGAHIARITQRLESGTSVEIIVWRDAPAVARADALQEKAESNAALGYTLVDTGVLADQRREMLLRLAEYDVLIAVRAAASESALRTIVDRLIELKRD